MTEKSREIPGTSEFAQANNMSNDNHTKHPEPAFQRFERVTILEGTKSHAALISASGTIIWRDLASVGSRPSRRMWIYVVNVPTQHCHAHLLESQIQSAGDFDREEMHFGHGYELSFDTIIEGHEKYIEGSYRLPGKFWEVFTLSRKDTVEIHHHRSTCRSGIACLNLQVPDTDPLDHSFVINVMHSVLGGSGWQVVHGPDSIYLC